MSSPLAANDVLDRVYLEIRCKLLDVAAALDRIARADDSTKMGTDVRLKQIKQGIDILSTEGDDRAERLQMLFSDPYIANWNRRETSATNGAGHH